MSAFTARSAAATSDRLADLTHSYLSTLRPHMRAAALVVTNASLVTASGVWGPRVLREPWSLTRSQATQAVGFVAEQHSRLAKVAVELDGRRFDDPSVEAHAWETAAAEVTALVLGSGFSTSVRAAAEHCLFLLGHARPSLRRAVDVMLAHSADVGTPPVPGPRRYDRDGLIRLGSALPPAFRNARRRLK